MPSSREKTIGESFQAQTKYRRGALPPKTGKVVSPFKVYANPLEVASVGGYRTFRQVVWGSSFEGTSTLGIGVRARLPFRVFTLPSVGGGSRLVVDVAHTW